MKFTLASLLTPMKSRQSRADKRWTFEVDRSSAPASVSWRWARHHPSGLTEHSQQTFATFADCARDAQAHGFSVRQAYALSDRPSIPATAWAGPRRASSPAPAANAADV
jgi:hypothetical protein